jgi:hypothetical protein
VLPGQDVYDRHRGNLRVLQRQRRHSDRHRGTHHQGGQDAAGCHRRPTGARADINGWYNRPVAISFGGSDRTSGIEACTATTYGGPDSAAASVTGTCRDRAGNVSAPFGYGLRYDQTAPLISGAIPERPPNAGGWFNRPVRFDIQASDATSGIADCPSVTYDGPDSASASFGASCHDQAGNTASRLFSLKYDATPAQLIELNARAEIEPSRSAGGPAPTSNGWGSCGPAASVKSRQRPCSAVSQRASSMGAS